MAALCVAFLASFVAGRWGFAFASTSIEAGPIWRQVLASLLAYKAFLAHYDAETKKGRPEYGDHERMMTDFQAAATSGS